MVEVSELAASVLVQSLQASGISSDEGFRLTKREEGFTLEVDSPAKDDRVIRQGGAIALIVDQDIEDEVGDVLIDVEDRPDGPQLMMRSEPARQ